MVSPALPVPLPLNLHPKLSSLNYGFVSYTEIIIRIVFNLRTGLETWKKKFQETNLEYLGMIPSIYFSKSWHPKSLVVTEKLDKATFSEEEKNLDLLYSPFLHATFPYAWVKKWSMGDWEFCLFAKFSCIKVQIDWGNAWLFLWKGHLDAKM